MRKSRKTIDSSRALFEKIERYFLFERHPAAANNIFHLCKTLGINLLPTDIGKFTIKDIKKKNTKISETVGCYAEWKDETTPVIYYNKNYLPRYLHYLLAHELCHLVGKYHSPLNVKKTSTKLKQPLPELHADAFASELLLPTQFFTYLISNYALPDIFSVRLSYATILFRILHKLTTPAFSLSHFPQEQLTTAAVFKIAEDMPYNVDKESWTLLKDSYYVYGETESPIIFFSQKPDATMLSARNLDCSLNVTESLISHFSSRGIDELLTNSCQRKKMITKTLNLCIRFRNRKRTFFADVTGKFFITAFPFTFHDLTGEEREASIIIGIKDDEDKMSNLFQSNDAAKSLIPIKYLSGHAENDRFDIYAWLNRLKRLSGWDERNYQELYGNAPIIEMPTAANLSILPLD
jgi:hypothetical protein